MTTHSDETVRRALEMYVRVRKSGKVAHAMGIPRRTISEWVQRAGADGRLAAIEAEGRAALASSSVVPTTDHATAQEAKVPGDSGAFDAVLWFQRALVVATREAEEAEESRDRTQASRAMCLAIEALANATGGAGVAGIVLEPGEIEAYKDWIAGYRANGSGTRPTAEILDEMGRLLRDPALAALRPGLLDVLEAASDGAILGAIADGDRGHALRERLAALLQKDTIARLQATAETFVAGVERDLHVETPGTASPTRRSR